MKKEEFNYPQKLKLFVEKIIKKVFQKSVQVEITPTPRQFGNFYSTPVALVLAKKLKKDPGEILEKLQIELEKDLPDWIEGIDISEAYLNFHLDTGKILENLQKDSNIKFQPKADQPRADKIIIEHTAANPNKSLHIGHLRNAILGDSLAKIYAFDGANLEIQNYIDDTGLQVAHTVLGLVAIKEKWFFDAPKQKSKQPLDEYYSDVYVWISEKLKEAKISDKIDLVAKEKEILHAVEEDKGNYAELAKKVVKEMLEAHLRTLQRLNIEYDLLVRESDLLRSGLWEKTFQKLKKSPKFVLEKSGINKGCWVLKYGDSREDKILIRADGTLVYTAKDIAYHLWKFGLIPDLFKYQKFSKQPSGKTLFVTSFKGKKYQFAKADKIINVIDITQSYPQKVVRDTLKILGYEKAYKNYCHLAYEQVLLSAKSAQELGMSIKNNKNFYKMSGRAGIDMKANHLIDEMVSTIRKHQDLRGDPKDIASGAVRFYLLSQRAGQRLIFDIDRALNTTGKSGVYCMYAFARCHGILRKTQSSKLKIQNFKKIIKIPEVIQLTKILSEFPSEIKKTIKESDPSYLADYAYNLAAAFNDFYEKHSIISEKDKNKKKELLVLVDILQKYLGKSLELLGIPDLKEI